MSCATGAFAATDPATYPIPPGFHVDHSGCYVRDAPLPVVKTPPPTWIEEYRRAAAAPPAVGAQPLYHDLVTRLPTSVALYRAGRIVEARSEWRRMLSDRISAAKEIRHLKAPPAGFRVHLLAERRLGAVAEREMPGGWSG